MPHTRSGLVALALAAAVTACGRTVQRNQSEPSDGSGVVSSSGHMVIEREILKRNDIPVLDALRYRVPGMTVSRTEDCPEVTLRGKSTLVTHSNPAIYVDGERASNTCVLAMLSTFHLARVEVYPSGIPPSGYFTNPYGVILIFSLNGTDVPQ